MPTPYEYSLLVDTEVDPGAWMARVRGNRITPPARMTATSKQGRSRVTVTTIAVSPEVQARRKAAYRKAQQEKRYLEALDKAGVALSPSLKKFI